jgi:hypothetical protein
MSIADVLAPVRTHRAWAAFVVLEVLVVAAVMALDFYAAGLGLAALTGISLAAHRHGLAGLRRHHGQRGRSRTPGDPAPPSAWRPSTASRPTPRRPGSAP